VLRKTSPASISSWPASPSSWLNPALLKLRTLQEARFSALKTFPPATADEFALIGEGAHMVARAFTGQNRVGISRPVWGVAAGKTGFSCWQRRKPRNGATQATGEHVFRSKTCRRGRCRGHRRTAISRPAILRGDANHQRIEIVEQKNLLAAWAKGRFTLQLFTEAMGPAGFEGSMPLLSREWPSSSFFVAMRSAGHALLEIGGLERETGFQLGPGSKDSSPAFRFPLLAGARSSSLGSMVKQVAAGEVSNIFLGITKDWPPITSVL